MSKMIISQRFDEDRARRAASARQGRNRLKGHGHPTTSDIDYSPDEMEFMSAVQEFKTATGRSFPTLCDYLRIVASLGYSKRLKVTEFAIPNVGGSAA